MKMATTRAEQRRWMQQWREAAIMLDEVKRDELANLSERDAWRQIEAVLSLAPHYRRLSRTSGLVKQQAWFMKFMKEGSIPSLPPQQKPARHNQPFTLIQPSKPRKKRR
jgi:hypothetical protein